MPAPTWDRFRTKWRLLGHTHRKLLIFSLIMLLLLAAALPLRLLPSRTVAAFYLDYLEIDLDCVCARLLSDPPTDQIRPASCREAGTHFYWLDEAGRRVYTTGSTVLDSSLEAVLSNYSFDRVYLSESRVVFYLTRFAPADAATVYALQYAPDGVPLEQVEGRTAQNTPLRDGWSYSRLTAP